MIKVVEASFGHLETTGMGTGKLECKKITVIIFIGNENFFSLWRLKYLIFLPKILTLSKRH